MQKLDIHVTSIPDRKAQEAIAEIIAESPSISLETARIMAERPPILLYRNVAPKEAEQYVSKLKSLGIGFKLSKAEEVPDQPEEEAGGSAQPADDPIAAHLRTAGTGTRTHIEPRNIHSDAHAGRTGLGNIEKMEKESKKKSLKAALITAAAFILLALLIHLLPQQNRFASNTSSTPARAAAAQNENRAGEHAQTAPQQNQQTAPQSKDRLRREISNTQRQQSNAYVDSARTCGSGNMERCIAFYRTAISFNRFNLAAWQGLLQAYRDSQMANEALETKVQMKELFGEEVMSVTSLVEAFGEVVDAYLNDEGAYRVEYKTQRRSKDDVLREVFNMTRAVRTACNCQNISIFASTGAGRGLLAHSTPQTSVHTLAGFMRQAEIVWLE
ncbi:MAG: hypothetical protein LBC70_07025 [Chitinispirillales bacterium]|jgi:hypothetical protein|nr:hypothetical protein [Chitinispirillales bacterium]